MPSMRKATTSEVEDHLRWVIHELTAPVPEFLGTSHLTKLEALVAGALMRRPGVPLTRWQLVVASHPESVPDEMPDDHIIDVFVAKIRRKIVDAPFRIEAVRGYGYVGRVARQPNPMNQMVS